jgi:acetolactate synthase II small subunit
MKHTIYVETKESSAGLKRLPRVVRHRGFDLRSLNMQPSRKAGHLNITATVNSSRSIDLLLNPLMKLYDVASVEVKQDQTVPVTG